MEGVNPFTQKKKISPLAELSLIFPHIGFTFLEADKHT